MQWTLFPLRISLRIPWDWKSPNGYGFAIALQMLTLYVTSQIFLCIPFIFYGFRRFFVGFADDIELSLRDFNQNFVNSNVFKVKMQNKSHRKKRSQHFDRRRIEIERKLGEIIDFHAETRQFSDAFWFTLDFLFFQFSKMKFKRTFVHIFCCFEEIFFVYFQVCFWVFVNFQSVHWLVFLATYIACSRITSDHSNCMSGIFFWNYRIEIHNLFLSFQSLESGNPHRVLQSLITFAIWTFLFYFFCNSGDEVSSRFMGISDAIYDCPWHAMPVKLRKCLQIMMCISQKPITLQGTNTLRNRKQFTKVCSFHQIDIEYYSNESNQIVHFLKPQIIMKICFLSQSFQLFCTAFAYYILMQILKL